MGKSKKSNLNQFHVLKIISKRSKKMLKIKKK